MDKQLNIALFNAPYLAYAHNERKAHCLKKQHTNSGQDRHNDRLGGRHKHRQHKRQANLIKTEVRR